ncbi:MAG: aromatic ring-hydroxylating dioxygenase subunit alpha [Hyphomonas sp.]|jgi:nitrite reductase/ring-hydroxylating ferredoxin subunit|uniref:Rieske 2Fe-2S domain-containing protein n=1 Tax=Hyphomonas sp. TaxID=87 RepID=UPI0008315498|nr:Rieske 2Fe-2S domain-containing protein [Hyphomonas sp.]MBA4082227.1 aromatic ring-hydroxylating dioxygenase subunit alpha [Erythrobacter sp.]MBA4228571.1 aromatic ring-hydroxylating dioxygenase subunit alpha [Hyphomonas sp.]
MKMEARDAYLKQAMSQFIDVENREVSVAALHDQQLYELELENIFAKAWLMIGHDSEIPNTGDYVVRLMGEDQVIVARAADGQVHVSLNVCPHRAMHVCLADSGNARVHKCIYHGWAFRPDGSFIGAPVEREQMHGNIKTKEQLGLKKARVQVYGGLIFATWNHDGPDLEEWLGDMKFYFDMLFDRTDKGLEVLGPPQRLTIDANWKTAGEQSACDGFHTLTLHGSVIDIGAMGGESDTEHESAPAMYGINLSGNGHSLRCIPADTSWSLAHGKGDLTPEQRLEAFPPPGITTELLPELKKNMSAEQLHVLAKAPPVVGGMFPNMNILFIYSPLRDGTLGAALVLHTIMPKGPHHFEWTTYYFAERGTPDHVKEMMRAAATHGTGTSGIIEQDDSDTWPHMTEAARGVIGRTETLKYQAILGENRPADWPDKAKVYEGFGKDDAQWEWWLAYHKLMTASA